jgi:hypothetical protein
MMLPTYLFPALSLAFIVNSQCNDTMIFRTAVRKAGAISLHIPSSRRFLDGSLPMVDLKPACRRAAEGAVPQEASRSKTRVHRRL